MANTLKLLRTGAVGFIDRLNLTAILPFLCLMLCPKKDKIDTAKARSHCEAILARFMRLPDFSTSFRQAYVESCSILKLQLQLQL